MGVSSMDKEIYMEDRRTIEKTAIRISGMLIMILALFVLFPARKVYAESYGLWVNNVQVTDENKDNVLGDAGISVKFDSASNTLTLNNASITEGYTYPDYYNPFTIGIYSTLSKLNIQGSGTISGSHTGILQNYSEGTLYIKGVDNGLTISGEHFGIRRVTKNSYDIGNTVLGGKITAACGDQSAIISWGSIEIENGSEINATYDDKTGVPNKYGLICNRGDIVIHGGTVTARGSEIGLGQYYNGSKELRGDIVIEDGTVTATGDTYAINSYKTINLKGGTVTAKGGRIGINTLETISLGKNVRRISSAGTNKAASSKTMSFEGNPVLVTPSGGQYNGADIIDSAGAIAKEVIIEPGGAEAAVKSLKLNKTSASVEKGKTIKLKATVNPSTATNKEITFKSSNKKIATVDSNGVVKAIRPGKATITAMAGNGRKATCKITVIIKTKSVTFSRKSYNVKKGKTITPKLTFKPKDATNKEVTYKSSNIRVATVDKNGNVKAKKKGKVKITATSKENKKIKAECEVVVN